MNQTIAAILARSGFYLFGHFADGGGAIEPLYISTARVLGNVEGFETIISELCIRVLASRSDLLAGVVGSGLPFSAGVSLRLRIPSITVRSSPENHGEGAAVQGSYKSGQSVLLIDDAIGDGTSKNRCIQQLEYVGLQVSDILTIWECGIPLVNELRDRQIRSQSLITHRELITYMDSERLIPSECAQELIDVYDCPERWNATVWRRWRESCARYGIPWHEPSYFRQ